MRPFLVGTLLIATVCVGLTVPSVAQTPAPDWREGFRAHDTNGDGRIDRAEFQEWITEGFYFRDQGRKGYLVAADLQGSIAPAVFKALNRKGDGRLTLSEYLNALFVDFAAADVNGDGTLTQDEIAAYIQQAKK